MQFSFAERHARTDNKSVVGIGYGMARWPIGRRSSRSWLALGRIAHCGLALTLAVGMPRMAHGKEVEVLVDARSAPWDVRVNRKFAFGVGASRPPKLVYGGTLFAGSKVRFRATGHGAWILGGQSFGPAGDPSFISDRSLAYLPSHFISQHNGPVAMLALVGAFVDADGAIIGKPFVIGDAAEVVIPEGAAAISLGVNDDKGLDNSGEFKVVVDLPEPKVIVGE